VNFPPSFSVFVLGESLSEYNSIRFVELACVDCGHRWLTHIVKTLPPCAKCKSANVKVAKTIREFIL